MKKLIIIFTLLLIIAGVQLNGVAPPLAANQAYVEPDLAANEAGRVPVIVTSSDREARTAVACLRAGADDFVRRPFDLEELRARVEAIG